MRRVLSLLLSLAVTSTALLAADSVDTDVKNAIQKFQEALERHDVRAIGALVSPELVVFENGHRNDGWTDFRDNHLIPEFKEPAMPSKWELVKVVATSEMAWGYTKQTLSQTRVEGKKVRYLVWSAYVLQRTGSIWKVVLLDWSVRRLGPTDSDMD